MSFDETAWWGYCENTFHEEQKQIVYASRMGLRPIWGGAHPPVFDVAGKKIVDIGGGPVSLLLKAVNRDPYCFVVDPGRWPRWVFDRYEACSIKALVAEAEDVVIFERDFDEAWIYNVLQHVRDPEAVIARAKAWAATIRIFEWVDVEPYPGHEHELRAGDLDEWLEGTGFVARVNDSGADGTAYYGVFTSS